MNKFLVEDLVRGITEHFASREQAIAFYESSVARSRFPSDIRFWECKVVKTPRNKHYRNKGQPKANIQPQTRNNADDSS